MLLLPEGGSPQPGGGQRVPDLWGTEQLLFESEDPPEGGGEGGGWVRGWTPRGPGYEFWREPPNSFFLKNGLRRPNLFGGGIPAPAPGDVCQAGWGEENLPSPRVLKKGLGGRASRFSFSFFSFDNLQEMPMACGSSGGDPGVDPDAVPTKCKACRGGICF